MAVDERAFAGLLRFYPKRWRDENGEDFLATALEDARSRGLERPDGALVRSTIVHGLGTRLTLRCAIAMALLGCVLTIVHQWLYTGLVLGFVTSFISEWREEYRGAHLLVESTVGLLAVPFVSITAIAALMRVRGRLSPPRAVGLVGGGALSFASWWVASAIGVALEEARGMAAQPLVDVVGGIGLWLSIVIMVIAVAFVAAELLEGAISGRALRWAVALALAAPIGMIVFVLTGIPGAWLLIDPVVLAAALVLALVARLGDEDPSTPMRDEIAASRPECSHRLESIPLPVKILVTTLALLGLAFASWDSFLVFLPGVSSLFGSGLESVGVPARPDVATGPVFPLLAPIAVFAAWGLVDSALKRHSLASIWGPIVFFCAAWAAVALMMSASDTGIGGAMWRAARALPFFTDPKGFDILATTMFILGVPGVIWLVDRYLPRRRLVRLLVAALVAVGCYFLSLVVIFGMVPFFVPLGVLVVLVRGWTATRLVIDEPEVETH